MKIKKIGAVCKASGRYYLQDQVDGDGDVALQWLGDGIAAYPLAGLPVMGLDNVCAMFDISDKAREKLILNHSGAPDAMNWGDADALERNIPEPKLCVRYKGMDLLPLETSQGVAFIEEKYLAPLDETDYLQLYERRSRDGAVYIAAKIGLVLWAIILPLNLPDEDFLNLLEDLTSRCRLSLRSGRDPAAGEARRKDGE